MKLQQIKSRKIQLLNLLLCETTYQPASTFASALGISTKTLYGDLEKMEEELEQNHLAIEKAPRKGIRFVGNWEVKERYIQNLYAHEQESVIPYSWLHRQIKLTRALFIDEESFTYETMAERYYVTPTSLRNDVDTLQAIFSNYGLRISNNRLCGEEGDIQKGLKQYIFNLIEGEEPYHTQEITFESLVSELFSIEVQKASNQAMDTLMKLSKRNISDYYVHSLHVTLMIFLSRALKNYHIKQEETLFEELRYLQPYLIALNVLDEIERCLPIHFEESDIKVLSSQLFAHGIEPKVEVKVIDEKERAVVDEIITRMSEILDVSLENDEKLKESLLYHIQPMIYRSLKGIRIRNPLLEDIKKQYMIMFSLTWYATSILEQTYQVSLSDVEVSFLTIHFQVALEKVYKQKNIIVVCPIGLATSELIFNKVRGLLSAKDNIRTASEKQIYTHDLGNVDFIISSIPLRELSKPVIYVSPLMTNRDIEKITQFNVGLNSRISTLRPTDLIRNSQMHQYFNENFVFLKQTFENKNDCLEFLIHQYEKNGYVNESFRKSLIDREAMGETSLYSGVALPHAAPSSVNKTMISVLTLKNKMKWGMNEVNVIITLAVSEHDLIDIKEVLARILKLFETVQATESFAEIDQKSKMMSELIQVL